MAKERVQKILARAGIASRRKAEEIIQEGGVTVNGKVIKLGDQAELGVDSIKVRGKLLQSTEAPVCSAIQKVARVWWITWELLRAAFFRLAAWISIAKVYFFSPTTELLVSNSKNGTT
jgi:hypothetical protein